MLSLVQLPMRDEPTPMYIVTTHGKPVFRELITKYDTYKIEIAKRIQAASLPNVARVYDVNGSHIDWELLDDIGKTVTDYFVGDYLAPGNFKRAWANTIRDVGQDRFREAIKAANEQLLSIGVYRIAWAPHCVSVGQDGTLKISSIESASCDDAKARGYRADDAVKSGAKTNAEINAHALEAMFRELEM